MESLESLPRKIQITALAPQTTLFDVKRACEVAAGYECAGICVSPVYLSYSMKNTIGMGVKNIENATVIGYPEGGELTSVKVYAAKQSELAGARRICLAMNFGAFLAGNYKYVKQDIDTVCDTVKVPVSIVIEAGILDDPLLTKAAEVVSRTQADTIITSTGFFGYITTPDAVKVLRSAAREDLKVQAAGKITDLKNAQNLIDAGADQLGLDFKSAFGILHEVDKALGRSYLMEE